MITSAFKNQDYRPMFILKEVFEEGTIPEYEQNNSIKQEIIIQNKAASICRVLENFMNS